MPKALAIKINLQFAYGASSPVSVCEWITDVFLYLISLAHDNPVFVCQRILIVSVALLLAMLLAISTIIELL